MTGVSIDILTKSSVWLKLAWLKQCRLNVWFWFLSSCFKKLQQSVLALAHVNNRICTEHQSSGGNKPQSLRRQSKANHSVYIFNLITVGMKRSGGDLNMPVITDTFSWSGHGCYEQKWTQRGGVSFLLLFHVAPLAAMHRVQLALR